MRSLDLGPPEGGEFFQHIADAKAYSSMGPPKVAGNLVYHGVGETSSPAESGFVESPSDSLVRFPPGPPFGDGVVGLNLDDLGTL